MYKFVKKTFVFLLPFALFVLITKKFYQPERVFDFYRIGSIPYLEKTYENYFELQGKEHFHLVSSTTKKKFDILTIGDSFSEQEAYGYKNSLAKRYTVLHIDRFISHDPYQTLVALVNGDFFEHYDIGTVILQGVERHATDPVGKIDLSLKMDKNELDAMIRKHQEKITNSNQVVRYEIFSRETILFPLYHLPRFLWCTNYYVNDLVGVFALSSDEFFSNASNKLIFLRLDQQVIPKNNDLQNIQALNDILTYISERLAQREIQFLFLPAPDKYSFYYDYLTDKSFSDAPRFFDLMDNIEKDYMYINTKQLLNGFVHSHKDLYFYNDSHWSPKGAKLIADEIIRRLEN
jgi:hypothetical protein